MIEYGIWQEQSDIRAHVSLDGRVVTVYRTEDMRRLISRRKYESKDGSQPGVSVKTFKGFLVPLADIDHRAVALPQYEWNHWDHSEMDVSAKGQMAVDCVKHAIRVGLFPLYLPVKPIHVSIRDVDMQYELRGVDLKVLAFRKWPDATIDERLVQVKYDYRAHANGSGNVFIQTHECNPRGAH